MGGGSGWKSWALLTALWLGAGLSCQAASIVGSSQLSASTAVAWVLNSTHLQATVTYSGSQWIAFGVSKSGGMKDCLIAIGVPGTSTSGFYTTSATSKSSPTKVASPGFSSPFATWYTQSGGVGTLVVVRPLAHATHPISASGSTSVVFGTGPSSAASPIQQHGSNKKVVSIDFSKGVSVPDPVTPAASASRAAVASPTPSISKSSAASASKAPAAASASKAPAPAAASPSSSRNPASQDASLPSDTSSPAPSPALTIDASSGSGANAGGSVTGYPRAVVSPSPDPAFDTVGADASSAPPAVVSTTGTPSKTRTPSPSKSQAQAVFGPMSPSPSPTLPGTGQPLGDIFQQHSATLDAGAGVSLAWQFGSGGTIAITASMQRLGWFAVGISPSGFMTGALAVIVTSTAAQVPAAVAGDDRRLAGSTSCSVSQYRISSYAPSGFKLDQSGLISASCSVTSNSVSVTFVRSTSEGTFSITADGPTNLVWARGSSLTSFNQHEQANVVAVDFGTGTVSAAARPGTHLAHGALNFLAWAVFLPAGVFMARFTKWMGVNAEVSQGPPVWFKWHRRLQVVGLLFTILAFIIALAMTADVNKQHFGNSHAKLGLAVTIFALLQPLNALIRPKPQPRTVNRQVWEVAHKGLGYLTLGLGALAIYLGLVRTKASGTLTGFYGDWVLLGTLAFVVLQVHKWLYHSDPLAPGTEDPKKNINAVTPAASTRSSGSNAFLPSPTDDDAMLAPQRREWGRGSNVHLPRPGSGASTRLQSTGNWQEEEEQRTQFSADDRRQWASASAVGSDVLTRHRDDRSEAPSGYLRQEEERTQFSTDDRRQWAAGSAVGTDVVEGSEAPSGYSKGRGQEERGLQPPGSRGSQGSQGSRGSKAQGRPPLVAVPMSRGGSSRGGDAFSASQGPHSHIGHGDHVALDDGGSGDDGETELRQPSRASSQARLVPVHGRPGTNASHGAGSMRDSGLFVSPLTDDDATTLVRQGSPSASTTSSVRRRSPRNVG